jgi:hypothetical protein
MSISKYRDDGEHEAITTIEQKKPSRTSGKQISIGIQPSKMESARSGNHVMVEPYRAKDANRCDKGQRVAEETNLIPDREPLTS